MQWRRAIMAFVLGISLSWSVGFLSDSTPAAAQTIAELQSKIADRQDRLGEIEAEIAEYEAALREVGAERSTLESAVQALELERRKINSDIAYTEGLIANTDLEINKISLEINEAINDIEQNQAAIGEMLRAVAEADDITLLEMMLANERFSDFWGTLDNLDIVRGRMRDEVVALSELKVELEGKRIEETARRSDLTNLQEQYTSQQQILVNNQTEKDELLTATRNEESEYQRLLNEQQQMRDQLIAEVRAIEAELQFILDPNTIPVPGTAVFAWPVRNVIITQLFGNTEFARQNPQVYGGRAYHPGVDFGAPRGTPIYAPLSGTVRDTGNTDLVPGCFSWGKWILIDHANGLSTLYAHQDINSVVPGQTVSTGEVIGYVGNTGFSTGPHLHFTVYVSDAVQVRQFNEFKSVTSCGAAKSPFAAAEGYLDPLDYLPPLP